MTEQNQVMPKKTFGWMKSTLFLAGATGLEIADAQNAINRSAHYDTKASTLLGPVEGRLKAGQRIFDAWIFYERKPDMPELDWITQ